MNGGSIISTTSGNLTFTGTATGTSNGINFNSGTQSVSSTSGGAIALTGTSPSGVDLFIDSTSTPSIGSTSGNISLTCNTLTIQNTGTLAGTGALSIVPRTDATTIGIAGGAGTLQLTTTLLNKLTDGFSLITLGSATGTGDVTINTHPFTDPITIRGGAIDVPNAQTLSTAGDQKITLLGTGVSLTGSGAVSTNSGNIQIGTRL